MNLNEIANEISKREDAEIAKAFTMVVASLLLSKGIQPIINKSLVEYDENDDINKYIIRHEYNVTFDIDTSEHDEKIRTDEREKAIEEFADYLKKNFRIGVNTIDDVVRGFKELKNEN